MCFMEDQCVVANWQDILYEQPEMGLWGINFQGVQVSLTFSFFQSLYLPNINHDDVIKCCSSE